MASLFLCYAHLTRQPISHLPLSTAELDLSVFSALLHPWLGLFPAQKKRRIIPAINADCMKSGGRWKSAAQERRLKYSGSRLTAGSLLPAYAGAIETPSQTENNDRMVNLEQDTDYNECLRRTIISQPGGRSYPIFFFSCSNTSILIKYS